MSGEPEATGAGTTIRGIASLDADLEASVDAARQRMRALLTGGSPDLFVGRYRLVERTGAGAMGQVWRARDDRLGRDVAIKLLKSGRHSSADVDRLAHEARSLARLSHPNVVEVFDLGAYDDPSGRPAVFLAMAFIEGSTLRRWAEASQRTLSERIAALVAAGRGLAAAHAIGLVHRDFKPDNVLVGRDGRVLVADFGLARLRRAQARQRVPSSGADEMMQALETLGASLTDSGTLVGTPVYMTPEQLLGDDSDADADVYAWCASAYEVLCGVLPFRGSLAEITRAKREGTTTPPRRPIPGAVMAVLVRGLAGEATRRWPSITAAIDALVRATRPRRWPWSIAALGLSAVVVAGSGSSTAAQGCLERTWDPAAWSRARAAADDGVRAATDAATAARTTELLDRRGAAIFAGAEQACAVRNRSEVSCWRDAAAELHAVADRLADPTLRADTVAKISDTLGADPSCSDVVGELEPPAALADAVDNLTAELATARVERRSDRAIEALARIDRVLQATTDDSTVPWPPLAARARYERGLTLNLLDDPEAAFDELSVAHLEAIAAGDPRLGFDAAIELVFVAVAERRATLGRDWLRHADAALARAPASPEASALLSSAQAELAILIDDLAAAATAVAEGEGTCAAADCGRARPRLFVSRSNLECVRRTERCIELLREAEATAIAGFGAGSIRAADAGIETVQGLLFLGSTEDALAHAEHVEARAGAVLGAQTLRRARLLSYRATALSLVERCPAAKTTALEALAIAERLRPGNELRFYERAVANAAMCSGEYGLALAMAERGIAGVEEGQQALVADFKITQAAAHYGLGRLGAARDALHEARELLATSDLDEVSRASLDAIAALIERDAGREAEAVALEERARATMRAICGARAIVLDGGRAKCAKE
jgi:hypothetical protein